MAETTKNSIIEATSRLMAIKGVKETSLSDIAKEVNISKGTLYYHYSSKDDIIYDIADLHLNKITSELLKLIDNFKDQSTPEALLVVVFEKILSAEMRGKLHLYLLGDAIMGNESLKQRFKEKYSEWRSTLEEGIQLILKDHDTSYELLAQIFLAMLDGFLIQKMIGMDDELPLEGVAQFLSQKRK